MVLNYWSETFYDPVCSLVGWSFCRSFKISKKESKLHFQAPIGALLLKLTFIFSFFEIIKTGYDKKDQNVELLKYCDRYYE